MYFLFCFSILVRFKRIHLFFFSVKPRYDLETQYNFDNQYIVKSFAFSLSYSSLASKLCFIDVLVICFSLHFYSLSHLKKQFLFTSVKMVTESSPGIRQKLRKTILPSFSVISSTGYLHSLWNLFQSTSYQQVSNIYTFVPCYILKALLCLNFVLLTVIVKMISAL